MAEALNGVARLPAWFVSLKCRCSDMSQLVYGRPVYGRRWRDGRTHVGLPIGSNTSVWDTSAIETTSGFCMFDDIRVGA